MPKKAIKVRVYPNLEQTILLYKTFGCCRKIYNTLLELKQNKLPAVTEAALKVKFPFMSEVDSIALQQSRMRLKGAYNNFFKSLKGQRKGPKMGPPKFKSKRNGHQSYKSVCVNENIKMNFETRHIKIPKIGWVKFRDDRIFSTKIRSITVSRDPSNRFYVSILINKIVPTAKINPEEIQNVVGYDMSLQHLTVNHRGEELDYPKFFKINQDKLAWEQRKLSHRVKGSKNYHGQKIKVARVHAKISDSRKDFLQKLSTQITNEYDVICTETLNMKAMAQSLKLGKSVNDTGWGMFLQMVEYKALWKGKYLIQVPKFFPSSKTCHVCGHIYKGLTLSERTWVCQRCSTSHGRDVNAAINIREEGIRIFNHKFQGTVGITETDRIKPVYAQGDCIRPVHAQDGAFSAAMSGAGSGR